MFRTSGLHVNAAAPNRIFMHSYPCYCASFRHLVRCTALSRLDFMELRPELEHLPVSLPHQPCGASSRLNSSRERRASGSSAIAPRVSFYVLNTGLPPRVVPRSARGKSDAQTQRGQSINGPTCVHSSWPRLQACYVPACMLVSSHTSRQSCGTWAASRSHVVIKTGYSHRSFTITEPTWTTRPLPCLAGPVGYHACLLYRAATHSHRLI